MNQPDQEFTREIIRKVRQIEIKSNRLVSEALSGSYHSAFKGQGIDFEEVREYQPGDEVRSIDWNVTAKMGLPFIKKYREERELTILLAIDISGSLNFGSKHASKREKLAELGALLAFSANRNGDKVGLLLFSDQVEQYLPPAKGQKHVLRILREILFHPNQSEKTDLNEGVRFINKVLNRRAVIFLLSDFIFPEKWGNEGVETENMEDIFLQELSATRRKHDLICAHVQDPHEQSIPNCGLVRLDDAESAQTPLLADFSNPAFRQRFENLEKERQAAFNQKLKKRGIESFQFLTDSDYSHQLKAFFSRRTKRRGF
jgi:uncharacterized protein (DUF58 family)